LTKCAEYQMRISTCSSFDSSNLGNEPTIKHTRIVIVTRKNGISVI